MPSETATLSSLLRVRVESCYLMASALNRRSAARTWRRETVPPFAGAGRKTRVPVRALWPRIPLRLEAVGLELIDLRITTHGAPATTNLHRTGTWENNNKLIIVVTFACGAERTW